MLERWGKRGVFPIQKGRANDTSRSQKKKGKGRSGGGRKIGKENNQKKKKQFLSLPH